MTVNEALPAAPDEGIPIARVPESNAQEQDALDWKIDPQQCVLREATEDEKWDCWLANSVAWAGRLSPEDYAQREAVNGSSPLTRDGGIHYWVFRTPSNQLDHTASTSSDLDASPLTKRHDAELNSHRQHNDTTDDRKDSNGAHPGNDTILAAVETLRKSIAIKTRDHGFQIQDAWAMASVFTRPPYRNHGVAKWMMLRLSELLDADAHSTIGGGQLSMLYSDVGDYYDPLGWPCFPSPQIVLPLASLARPTQIQLPTTQELTRESLESLCAQDTESVKADIHVSPLNADTHARMAVLPTYAQAAWHFGAEGFMASKLFDPPRSVTVKGAACYGDHDSSVPSTWGYWVHDFNERKLTFLRLVSSVDPSDGASQAHNKRNDSNRPNSKHPETNRPNSNGPDAVRSDQLTGPGRAMQELAAIFEAARVEMTRWDEELDKMTVWAPSDATVAAAQLLVTNGDQVTVHQRTDGSIPGLRWRGDGAGGPRARGVEWTSCEKYSWC